jgi:hypothetical protein
MSREHPSTFAINDAGKGPPHRPPRHQLPFPCFSNPRSCPDHQPHSALSDRAPLLLAWNFNDKQPLGWTLLVLAIPVVGAVGFLWVPGPSTTRFSKKP